MKCNQCNLVEMLVMARNNNEVVYQCPKCRSISKIEVEEEQRIIKEQQEKVKESEIDNEESSV